MSSYPIERRAANRLPPMQAPGDAFGVRGAVDSLLQYGRLVLTVFGLVMAATALYALLAPPVYRADTLLQIDAPTPSPMLPGLQGSERNTAAAERLTASGEMEVLGSREMMMPVIAEVGADVQVGIGRRWGWVPVGSHHGIDVQQFSVPASQAGRDFELIVEAGHWQLASPDGTLLASGSGGAAKGFALADGQGTLQLTAPADGPRTQLSVRQLDPITAYDEVMTRLRMFEPARESGVVRIGYEDSRPTRAAAMLNTLVARYLQLTVQRKQAEGAKALALVEDQLPALRARVTAAENALSEFQKGSGAAPVNTEADALLRQRGDLERQALELRIKRDQLAVHLTPEHPDLAAVLRQLGTVQGALSRLGGDAARLPEQTRDVQRLQRAALAETQVYTAMLAQAEQLRLMGSGWKAHVRQVDRAAVPIKPVRPKAAAVISIGVALGLLAGMAAALLARSLQPTVSGAHDLQAYASPPTLAVIPESAAQMRLMEGRITDDALIEDLGTHRLLARAVPNDPAVESLRAVHLTLMLRERSVLTQVIMVTSPSAGTGKSFVAANLAALMAETGKRVLLIETDLRKPGLHKFIGIDEFASGLSDLLVSGWKTEEVVHRHPSVGIDVILQGNTPDKSGTMLMSQAFEAMLTELRERYDYIIINAAPLLPSSDALAVGRLTDMALMVLRAEQSLLQETRTALRRLEQSGIKVEGLLFNGVKRTRLSAPVLT